MIIFWLLWLPWLRFTIVNAFLPCPIHQSPPFTAKNRSTLRIVLFNTPRNNDNNNENAKDHDEDNMMEKEDPTRKRFLGMEAAWRAKELAQDGLGVGLSSAKQMVQSVGGVSASIASQGRDSVTTVVGSALSGLSKVVVSTGHYGVSSATRFTKGGLRLAKGGFSNVSTMAESGRSKASDVIQWLDHQAKDGTLAMDSTAKKAVLVFTGKSDYQFGDIAKEVIRRASSVDYNLQDILLLLKILLTLGATVTPLAKILPITVLLEMLNTSLEARLGATLLEALAKALDARFVAAFSAEELGDLAKRSLGAAIVAFTGKSSYQQGDMEEAVAKIMVANNDDEQSQNQETDLTTTTTSSSIPTGKVDSSHDQVLQPLCSPPTTKTFNLQIGPEFADWDQAFRASHPEWAVNVIVGESLITGTGSDGFGATPLQANNQGRKINMEALDITFVSEMDEWDQKFARLCSSNSNQNQF
jgi:hypothetical protein